MPPAEKIGNEMKRLIQEYESKSSKEITDILDFHVRFEQIVPFEDGNGRVGRLIMFKECVRHDLTPFIIDDKHRSQYLAGLAEWWDDRAKMTQLVAHSQGRFKRQLRLNDLRESPLARMRNYDAYGDDNEEESDNAHE